MPPKTTGRGGSQKSPQRPLRQNQTQAQNSTTRRRKPEPGSDEEAVVGQTTRKSLSNSTNSSPQRSMTKRERHEFHLRNDLCFRCEQPGHRANEHDLGRKLYQQQSGRSLFTSSPRLGGQVGGRVASQQNVGRVPALAPRSSPHLRQSPPRPNMQSTRQARPPIKRSPELRSFISEGEWRVARKIEGDAGEEQEKLVEESTPRPRVSQSLKASQTWLASRPPAILDGPVAPGRVKTVVVVRSTEEKAAVMTSPSEDFLGLDSPLEQQDGCSSASVEDLSGLEMNMELVDLGIQATMEGSEATQGERQVEAEANPKGQADAGAKEHDAPEEERAETLSKSPEREDLEDDEAEGETVVFRGRGRKEGKKQEQEEPPGKEDGNDDDEQ